MKYLLFTSTFLLQLAFSASASTIAEKLSAVADCKADIKAAIEAKGVTVGDAPLADYAAKILAIPTGGGQSWVRFTITKKHKATGTLDNAGLGLARLSLYSGGGNLVSENLVWVQSTSTPLSENQFWFGAGKWVITAGSGSWANVFSTSMSSKMYFTGSTGAAQLENGDPDYYVTFTMRLADGTVPIKYNIAIADSGVLQGRNPVSWKVETSTTGADGSWTVASEVNDETPPTTNNTWYNGGGTGTVPTTFYYF